jgi:hypothetical protein
MPLVRSILVIGEMVRGDVTGGSGGIRLRASVDKVQERRQEYMALPSEVGTAVDKENGGGQRHELEKEAKVIYRHGRVVKVSVVLR